MKRYKHLVLGFLLSFLTLGMMAQDRYAEIEQKLEAASKDYPGLNNPVDMTVNHYTLAEVIRTIADDNELNVMVDASLTDKPTYTFSNASVKELFLFFCKQHNLQIEWTGSIMAFNRYVEEKPKEDPKITPTKPILLSYDKTLQKVTATLENDTLYNVLKKLSEVTGINIDVEKSLQSIVIRKHIVALSFDDALDVIIDGNLKVKINDSFYRVIPNPETAPATSSSNGNGPRRSSTRNGRTPVRSQSNAESQLKIDLLSSGKLEIDAVNTSIVDVIKEMSDALGVNYYILNEPTDNITIKIVEKDYEEVMTLLLNGGKYTYSNHSGIFLVGERTQEGLRSTKVIQLQYRTSEKIVEYIPADIRKDVEIIDFDEQNSIILSGSEPQINEIEKFIRMIDKVVPVVLIEVMIVDVNKSFGNSNGIEAGFKNGEVINEDYSFSGGETSATLDGNALNAIINSFNGFGLLNLGLVSSDFYLTVKALEENGYIKTKSTPKLATLNGHEASMSIGKTEYYSEQRADIIGQQNPSFTQTTTFKPVNADFSLTIKPIVSGDGQITLEIEVSQSDFVERINPNAPPNSVTRDFKSTIRIKDQEVVILGGLEDKSTSETGKGVPWLSRIPVIKWFFSSRSKERKKAKLNIFIKPTIIY